MLVMARNLQTGRVMEIRGRELGHALRARYSRSTAVDQIDRAAKMLGWHGERVAAYLQISPRTLDYWIASYPEVRAAMGRAQKVAGPQKVAKTASGAENPPRRRRRRLAAPQKVASRRDG